MRRFYFNETHVGGQVELRGAEADHITRVLRMQQGDKLLLFNGSGIDYTARIHLVEKDCVRLDILEQVNSVCELDVEIVLCQALIKHDHFEYAVQKCTELGVKRFVPFLGERCVKKPKSPERFLERANRVALEAAKQCGRSFVPRVEQIAEFQQLVTMVQHKNTLFAYECEQQTSLKQALKKNSWKEIYIVVGPEGGFAPVEAEQLIAAGALSVSLGRLVLRAETAGMAAVAMVSYECGGQQ